MSPTDDTLAPGSLEEALLELRQGIDSLDDQIVGLLNRRASLSLEVGRRKAGRDSAVFKPFREQEVLARLTAANPGPLPANHLMRLPRITLLGSSPELLIRCRDGELTTCPIAGTRPRSKDPVQDDKLAEELMDAAGLDLAQLHGDQSPEFCQAVGPERVIRAFWPRKHADIPSLAEAMDAVNEGHIFRFLTKPCPIPCLSQALDAGLDQYRLVAAEKELLRVTLENARLKEDVERIMPVWPSTRMMTGEK